VKDEPADAVSAPWFPPVAPNKKAVNDGDSDTEDDSVLDPESDNDDTNEREDEWEQVPESNTLDSDFEVVEAEVCSCSLTLLRHDFHLDMLSGT
jgi:hypothetical protein